MPRSRNNRASASDKAKAGEPRAHVRTSIVLSEESKVTSREIRSDKIKKAVKRDMKLFNRLTF